MMFSLGFFHSSLSFQPMTSMSPLMIRTSDFLSLQFSVAPPFGVSWGGPPTAKFMEAVQRFIAHFMVFNGVFFYSHNFWSPVTTLRVSALIPLVKKKVIFCREMLEAVILQGSKSKKGMKPVLGFLGSLTHGF